MIIISSIALFFTVGVAFIVMGCRRARRSSGGTSASLGLLRGIIAVGLLVTMFDTANDLYIAYVQNQEIKPPPSVSQVVKKLKKSNRRDRRAARNSQRRSTRPKSVAAARNVTDRKYDFLGYLAALATFIYILGRPSTWEFVTRFFSYLLLSWRGTNPWQAENGSKPPPVEFPEPHVISAMAPSANKNPDDDGH